MVRLSYRGIVSIRRVEMHAVREPVLGGTVSFFYGSRLGLANFLLFVMLRCSTCVGSSGDPGMSHAFGA